MITPEQREVIITEIGSGYGTKILDFAKKRKFKKERGGGFYKTANIFYDVLDGRHESTRIEAFLLKVYQYYKRKNQKHNEKMRSELKPKK